MNVPVAQLPIKHIDRYLKKCITTPCGLIQHNMAKIFDDPLTLECSSSEHQRAVISSRP